MADDHVAILKQSVPLIDVRAPGEFARGAVPGAVNLPLLTDDERATVGKTYKQRGRTAAIELGHRLVGGDVKRARLAAWRHYAQCHPRAMMYCWRGGMRSALAQRWLADSGVRLPRVAGGFKALRHCCLDAIAACGARRFLLVGGRTGCGKTAVVRSVATHIDLEALANHRGSAFGGLPTPQPPPVGFENALAVALLKLDPDATVVVEDESRTIGRLAIPEALYNAMQQAPIAMLEVPDAERVDNIYREYVVQADNPREHLPAALKRIERRLGGVRHRQIAALMRAAFAAADGGAKLHRQWIARLLADYYDPMYDYQIAAKTQRIAMRGSANDVRDFVKR